MTPPTTQPHTAPETQVSGAVVYLDQPTPCYQDSRWLTTDEKDVAEAVEGCLGCPALFGAHDAFGGVSCTQARLDLLADDHHFAAFEGVMAAEVHDPLAARRARQRANRGEMPVLFDTLGRRRKTHCKRGHEFHDDNTYIDPKGTRICRDCRRLTNAQRAAEKEVPTQSRPTACARGHEFTFENTKYEADGRRRCRECRRNSRNAWVNRQDDKPTTSRNSAA